MRPKSGIPIPLVRGDGIAGVEYRDRLPTNAQIIIDHVHGVEGYLMSHQGLFEYGSAPGADRGGVFNERLSQHLRVSGNKLVRVDHTGLGGVFNTVRGRTTEIGTISGTRQASLPYSFESQAIIADGKMWLYDGATLTRVTDSDLGNPVDGIWINGYYLMTDGEFLFHTDLNDEASIEPTRYATSEFSPDDTIGIAKSRDNQAVVFNRYSTEYFRHEPANSAFKFSRIESKAVKTGIVGPHLKTELGGRFYCLGNAKNEAPSMVVIMPGRVENFSTREVDLLLEEYTEAELATGVMESRVEERNELVYVHLPRHTLVYNFTAAKLVDNAHAWSIVKSGVNIDRPWDGINGVMDIDANQWIYGDRTQSRLGVLGGGSSQYGVKQECIFYSPFANLEGASIDQFEINTVSGFSLEDMKVFVSITYDGRTYGREWSLLYGSPLDYGQRFIARRLGYINHWVGFKFRIVANSRISLANMVLHFE